MKKTFKTIDDKNVVSSFEFRELLDKELIFSDDPFTVAYVQDKKKWNRKCFFCEELSEVIVKILFSHFAFCSEHFSLPKVIAERLVSLEDEQHSQYVMLDRRLYQIQFGKTNNDES